MFETPRSIFFKKKKHDILIIWLPEAGWKSFFYFWAVLSDEQMSNGWPFSLLNDEQMSNNVRVEHQPDFC